MKCFFELPMTMWPAMRNRLHIYALPGPDLRAALVERQRALEAFDYCSIQPAGFLHATVQQFALTADEASPGDIDAFMHRLERVAAVTKPFSIELGEPVADSYSLGVRGIASPAWARMTDAIRDAANATIHSGRSLPNAPAFPHLSLGYAVAEGSTELIQKASDQLTGPVLPPLTVQELHFVAVHQDPSRGIFTWDTTTPLPFSSRLHSQVRSPG